MSQVPPVRKQQNRPTPRRTDVVFIRKSSASQDEVGQIDNVKAMLADEGVEIPGEHWFVCTVPRAKVQANSDFKRLMDLVTADKIGTIYIESLDRWGTGNVRELFALLNVLAEHDTRLYDLRDKTDLTQPDDATEIHAFHGGMKSKKERKDISYRSLRTRVGLLKEKGSWPTGPHPFGFGKACFTVAGDLMWVWQPHSRTEGRLFYPDPKKRSRLVAGPIQRLPRKNKGQRERTELVPSDNPAFVSSVRLIFELYVKVGLSRRQIAGRLNKEGRKFYDRPFTYADVGEILKNPTYVGDTHFGKTQTGEHHTFDNEGLIVPLKRKADKLRRDEATRIIKRNTHKGLIDRPMWELAQAKLTSEEDRPSFSPRNPDYYLRQIFVCGHCGKNMTGRPEQDPSTGKKKVVYVCSTYVKGRSTMQEVPCGYHRISHDDAERLLLEKIKELGLRHDTTASESPRVSLETRLAQLGHEDHETKKQWRTHISEGVRAFVAHMREIHPEDEWQDHHGYQKLARIALYHYWDDQEILKDFSYQRLKLEDLGALREAVQAAEEAGVADATKRVAELTAEHEATTRNWTKASEAMQVVLKRDAERLEAEIAQWTSRTVPLSQRFVAINRSWDKQNAEREQLLTEWPTLKVREKGESLRRLFKTVTLFWERTFIPSAAKPTRPRKTNRPGRYRYTLQYERIQWAMTPSDLNGSSSRTVQIERLFGLLGLAGTVGGSP